MVPEVRHILGATLIGLGATLLIDLWALLLKRCFNIPSLSYCLLGRWLLHMPSGTFLHDSIGGATPKRHECPTGWVAHYLIGTTLAVLFIFVAPRTWLPSPTLLPALAFGVATTLVPYLVMQPALGLGIAASRTPKPNQARLKSLSTHAVFGLGLYLWATLLSRLLFHA
jgi:hypothetical protein